MYLLAIIIGIIVIISIIIVILSKKSVATFFIMQYDLASAKGKDTRGALKDAIDFFRYRSPFNQLDDDEADCILEALADIKNPKNVGSKIFQLCEARKNVSLIKDKSILEQTVIKEDIFQELQTIMGFIAFARKNSEKFSKYPINNILFSYLQHRKGWAFKHKTEDSCVFNYNNQEIFFPKQTSGFEIVKRIILVEINAGCYSKEIAISEIVNNYDEIFEECFSRLNKPF
ncbi:MAG: hypothetical protein NT145_05190 [Elusimicrobia bacterium]|nr:hypothetical protein [Elusimicrobiota bacterium]